MRIKTFVAAAALGLAAGVSGCSNWLDSPKSVADPNNPTVASTSQLFVGTQVNMFGQQEGPVAMIICEWMQQCSGVNGRFVDSYANYQITAGSFDGSMASLYTAGGLGQLRQVEKQAKADNNMPLLGMSQVIEAMDMMWGTDIWGDLPYSDAVSGNATPKFDTQQQIYTRLLAVLDSAITELGSAGGPNPADDLLYGGLDTQAEEKQAWIEAAHTLKARIHLHQVEKLGNAEYTAARTEALLGIASPAHDMDAHHGTATSERNMWFQFQLSSFGNDLVAGSKLVDIMKADGDPRLSDYFGKDPNGGYGGWDIANQNTAQGDISPLYSAGRFTDPTFPQPLITWDENQLILAEANFVLTGAAAAQPYLDAVRAKYGKASVPATLASIMQEKYITLYQNVEAWNDHKRTCLPALTPAKNKTVIPGRLLYGQTEVQTNSANVPAEQALAVGRNWNDPAACP